MTTRIYPSYAIATLQSPTRKAETIDEVIVNDADRLHEGVADCAPNELETLRFERLRHRL